MPFTDTSARSEGERYAPGKNAVEVKPLRGSGGYYRSYEIYGRRRIKDSQHLVNPRWFLGRDYLLDPYPSLAIMRENYEFYRDWINNADWVSRYNDATSIFVDDANFETRSRLWHYGMEGYGRDLREQLPVVTAWANGVDGAAAPIIEALISDFAGHGSADLVGEFSYRLTTHLLASALDLPREQWDRFGVLYHQMMDGWQWDPRLEVAGKQAITELSGMMRPLLDARRTVPGGDLVSAIAGLELEGSAATAEDVVTTLLEGDGETLFGSINNTLFQLFAHPEQLDAVRHEHLLIKRAWQEAIRFTTPTLQVRRFARQEVERYGRLIPEGGLVYCSAAAGNRDPHQFANPDSFDIYRKDLCYREPRGQYRADGLPAGIAFGLGPPSRYPAVPEDRPRSLYAITANLAVLAIESVLGTLKHVRLAPDAAPLLLCRWPWDMHTCWDLPVVFDPA